MEAKEVDDWGNLGTSYISVCCLKLWVGSENLSHTREEKEKCSSDVVC